MRVATALAASLILAGCGSSFRAHTGPDDPIPAPVPGPDVGAIPAHDRPRSMSPTIRHACRVAPVPRGWIAVQYMAQKRECPPARQQDGYNGVVLEHFADRAIGSVMTVCADQPAPRGWLQEAAPPGRTCEGARVPEGKPTATLIRRVR